MGEGVDFHDLLVAGLDRGRRLEALFFRDDIDGFDETVALARIDAEVEVDLLARRERGRGGLGEIGLMPKRRVDRGADEDAPGKAGQERAGEPAQRDLASIEGGVACAIGLDGRIHAKFDAGAETGRAEGEDRGFWGTQWRAHRHRVASILATAR